ncbi:4'-phosphopantetheinyl transferase family protein [Thermomonas paludicola]|uniref:4'-phosphopantetheinyl transferase family protein n=1 Tax=Thermomonas paludicola TaxID=2884874 RepID=UPI0021154EEE|nr:4'-phosphopantetheinyl transferase superfamily protein [Thermomonas paludicola]
MTVEVRLHLAGVDDTAASAQAAGLHWLTDAEQHRLRAMRVQARRDSFIAGHWLARHSAAQWLQLDATRVALGRQADGRPLLCVDGAPGALQVSLSHSGNWLVCAIATRAVGVDVEVPRKPRKLDALAGFVFSVEETRRLRALPEDARPAAFHQLWTLKEARGKRSGEGLLPQQARRVSAVACAAAEAEAMSWAFHDGALALAVDAATRVSISGQTLGEPAYWRYVASDPARAFASG